MDAAVRVAEWCSLGRRAHPCAGQLAANECNWQSHTMVCTLPMACASAQRSTRVLCCTVLQLSVAAGF